MLKEEEEEERGGGVGVDDKRWLRVTSGGNILKFPILVTSIGNNINQLVYVANHNKTFETHALVSSSYGKIQIHSYIFHTLK